MPKVDVTDEAIVDAPPMEVFKAVLDMYAGGAQWMPPTVVYKLRGDKPFACEGAICDVTLRDGRVTIKISDKVTKVVEAKLIRMECAGDFVGTGEWTFEPTANGKTKVQYRWNARTNRLFFSLASPFVNIGQKHSDDTQKLFKALNSYLSKK